MTATIAKIVNTVARAYIFAGDSSMAGTDGVDSSETCCEDRRRIELWRISSRKLMEKSMSLR